MPRLRALALALLTVAPLAVSPALAGRSGQVREDSFKLLNEGVAAYNRGDYPAAVEALRKCSSMALNSFRAHYFLGVALIANRRYSEAIEPLKIALELDPNHLQSHVALGDAMLYRGDLDEAFASYYRALKLRAEYAAALDGIARAYDAQGDDDNAIVYFERAIASNKGFAEAYTHLGDLYLRQNRVDKAVSLLFEAVTIRPDYGPGLNRLARGYNRLGLRNEAVATIQKAISLEPKTAEHQETLGAVLLDMGLLEGAEAAFRKAIALDPGTPGARGGLAELARRRGDYPGAIREIDAALADARLDTRTREAFVRNRAEVAAEQERLASLEPKLEAGTATADDLVALADIYGRRFQWGRAADLMASSKPEGSARERLAYYLYQSGRYRDSYDVYKVLADAAPRGDLETNAGVALAKLGDPAGAAAAFRRALSIDPNIVRAKVYLANALLRQGKKGEAVALYQEFLKQVEFGESVERVRRILAQIAPGALPPEPPKAPVDVAPRPPEAPGS